MVEVTLDRINVKNFLTQRFLDPTCGSASFLLALIRKIKIQATDDGWGDLEVLKHIINNVWGFDLNPLAVQTARVNILIAISDLLDNNKGTDIEIPILLADAVYSPARNPKKDELIVSYKIGSEVADLEILLPSELAFDRSRLDSVFLLMDNLVSKSTQWRETEKKINTKKINYIQ
ncbi:hypothetical protein [sulfur-oxidizing endosymbiont of Gigantopelta aegis]|uniref:hypothetical protein n=1 Tax=sulfur-oxidizing endosymbiont of Gigantopelta aegis TaxID=2794934 RepID=UPI0018DE5380|nr:hypothetical protein [sulfur-oxidizing endosymbiont of Gigantopelta aegis]